jgi:hypothetical protein
VHLELTRVERGKKLVSLEKKYDRAMKACYRRKMKWLMEYLEGLEVGRTGMLCEGTTACDKVHAEATCVGCI